ncbi:hypothetical protein B0H10DRAFT_1940372 [Mycena sp. CBHHK59/15]|nr:hypothetical protein B0H10DRAFT_1940372 [Mycena sp. CBHHK59/15]
MVQRLEEMKGTYKIKFSKGSVARSKRQLLFVDEDSEDKEMMITSTALDAMHTSPPSPLGSPTSHILTHYCAPVRPQPTNPPPRLPQMHTCIEVGAATQMAGVALNDALQAKRRAGSAGSTMEPSVSHFSWLAAAWQWLWCSMLGRYGPCADGCGAAAGAHPHTPTTIAGYLGAFQACNNEAQRLMTQCSPWEQKKTRCASSSPCHCATLPLHLPACPARMYTPPTTMVSDSTMLVDNALPVQDATRHVPDITDMDNMCGIMNSNSKDKGSRKKSVITWGKNKV